MTNSEEEKFDLIERYVNRLLSSEEQEAFERQISQDPELKRDVEAYTEAQELIFDQGILEVKMKLQNIHQSELRTTKGRKYYLPGAVLVIVSASLLYLYFTASDPVKEEEPVYTTVTDTIKVPETPIAATEKTEEKNTVVLAPSAGIPAVESPDRLQDPAPVVPKDKDTEVIPPVSTDPPVDQEKQKDKKDVPPVVTVPTVPKDDCASVQITGDLMAMESCAGQSTGTIVVSLSSLKGGAKPYTFSLEKEDGFRSGSQFTGLSAGQYKVYVKDKNNCTAVLKPVEIKSKVCVQEYAFNPERGEEWSIPVPADFKGELKILNRSNERVFSTQISYGSPSSWTGTDNSGMLLPKGVYMFTLIPDNGETIKGYVTILR